VSSGVADVAPGLAALLHASALALARPRVAAAQAVLVVRLDLHVERQEKSCQTFFQAN